MKIGLVFSGGGLKGNAHIGVLKALDVLGVKYDVVTGTSAGAIVTAMLMSGMDYETMLNISTNFNKDLLNFNFRGLFKTIFDIVTFRRDPLDNFKGFISASKLDKYLNKIFDNKKLLDIKPPFALVSTDLITGHEVILSNNYININNCICINDAKLGDAVRASISVPLVFVPKKIGKCALVDGGVLDNLPVDAAKALGADKIIAVNLEWGAPYKETDNLLEIGGKAVQLLTNRSQFYKSYLADVYINPDLSAFSTDDFSPIDAKKMMEIGYNATMAIKEQILALFDPTSDK